MPKSKRLTAGAAFNLYDIIKSLTGKNEGATFTTSLFFTNAPGACNFVRMQGNGLEVRAVSLDNGTRTRFIVTKSSAK